ncbi:MAG: lamin tail domain-containing protein [Chlorobi bacterium]|nr:lamin tail domain-containing protein [Chlorobiota bacterium]
MKQLFTLICLLPILAFTQINEDFSDGNFTQNPPWTGDTENFTINGDLVLRLDDDGAGESGLFTNNSLGINCEWRFWVKLSFSPSANNNARIYLLSENGDFVNQANAYFLQLGESGSDDAIELFRQDGSEKVSVCRGEDGLISSSFALGIKIIRNTDGLWQVFADEAGGENYKLQAEGLDNTYQNTGYFGFYCKYTSSNSGKFYFDNIYVGDIYVDTEPPVLQNTITLSDSSLLLTYNEALDTASAENILNYSANNQLGNPERAKLDDVDNSMVELIFAEKFPNGQQNTLSIGNIADIAGNMTEAQEVEFMFFVARGNDLIINEIMADPTPVVGLPGFEYLEIHNLLPHAIKLNGWTLQIGSSSKTFENVEIEADGFLILAKNDAEESLSAYGDFYGFSSFSLTNSGQDVQLLSPEGNLISAVSYEKDWYNDDMKMQGGWSLELINPGNICSGKENWVASNDNRGGSPGGINSVNSNKIFYPGPLKLELLDTRKIQVVFNQSMDSASLGDINNFEVNQQVGNPVSIFFSGFKPEKAILRFPDEFKTGTTYDLRLKKQIRNCNGDEMQSDTILAFGVAEKPEYLDVVINEVLFNPLGEGVDFVELYNNSFKVVDLGDMKVGSVKTSPPNPPDTSIYDISPEPYLLLPGKYVCITSSPQAVKSQYFTENALAFVKTSPFPSLNNDKGTIMIFDEDLLPIDYFDYSKEMHFPLLNYLDGVSLERLSFLSPTNDANNWHSAAESVGFATPAYENSQVFLPDMDDGINIEPEIFSPDNDGHKDVVAINYSFAQAGFMLSIDIFNSSGYPIRKLVNNEYIGNSGSVFWDGTRDDNAKASVGIYIVYIQVFDLGGNRKSYKKTCVLGAKL